ncbi:hypothetical protein EHF33_15090 [Deinococcus psychrotolerans]|uniref:Uncharacterized protein n=1 Tax=Deinococcus psychrotolerans TaxID=2489213 RepID=A0A3G8YFZ8_9DEIO|nr:hypothetical protein [Deinococcus psychrotolerans]AZI44222.1 hypothetical protein EHF33_15090 [Deinococcus psychrotolerans]
MPKQPKKFNAVRATRLSLLMALSLTVGLGTAIYSPLAHIRPTKAGEQQTAQAQADPISARLPELVPAPQIWEAATQDAPVSVVASPRQSVSQDPASEKPERLRSTHEDESEGSDEEGRTEDTSAVRLVRAVQRVPEPSAIAAHQSATTPRLTPQAAPALSAQPAAPLVRQAIPRIVRRPAAPVIATTSAS